LPTSRCFREAFQRDRCMFIPASGYYEWLKKPDGRQPYFISAADGGVLSFAGLYDRWKNPEDPASLVTSCTIIVTDAVIADSRLFTIACRWCSTRWISGRWLNGEGGTELLKPAAETCLRMWPGIEAGQQDRQWVMTIRRFSTTRRREAWST